MSVKEVLEVLLAIEKLEYHNKNWLHIHCASNPKEWSLKKQQLMESGLRLLEEVARGA